MRLAEYLAPNTRSSRCHIHRQIIRLPHNGYAADFVPRFSLVYVTPIMLLLPVFPPPLDPYAAHKTDLPAILPLSPLRVRPEHRTASIRQAHSIQAIPAARTKPYNIPKAREDTASTAHPDTCFLSSRIVPTRSYVLPGVSISDSISQPLRSVPSLLLSGTSLLFL